MGNRRINPDMKYCALRLWNQGWDTEDICDMLAISCSSLYRWRRIFAEHGHVNRPPSPLVGRTKILALAAINTIRALYEEEPDLYLDEVRTFLAIEHDIAISKSTLS